MPRKSEQETVRIGTKDPLYTPGLAIGRDSVKLGVSAASKKHGCSEHTTRYWGRVFNFAQKSEARKEARTAASTTTRKAKPKFVKLTVPSLVIEQLRSQKSKIDSIEADLRAIKKAVFRKK